MGWASSDWARHPNPSLSAAHPRAGVGTVLSFRGGRGDSDPAVRGRGSHEGRTRGSRAVPACGEGPVRTGACFIVGGEERIPSVSARGAHTPRPHQRAPGDPLSRKRPGTRWAPTGCGQTSQGNGTRQGVAPDGSEKKDGPGTKRFPQVHTTRSVFLVGHIHLPALRAHHALSLSSHHKSRPEGLYQDQTRTRKNEQQRRREVPCLPLRKVNLRTHDSNPRANELILNPLPR